MHVRNLEVFFEDFENFEYNPTTIIHFEVVLEDSTFEVEEEIMSLNFLERIDLFDETTNSRI